MATYSIKELERLSGIKAHTLRIWEKRYDLIEPQRTDTNIRYYSDEDLKKIINVSILNRNGFKIGKIAKLSAEEINDKINELHKVKGSTSFYRDQLLMAMVEMDEVKFEKLLSELILKHGFETSLTSSIFPFLEKIGVMYLTNSVSTAQEHFISSLIRQKIIVGIDALPLENEVKSKVILFLPEGELHEIALLFINYYLRKQKVHTCYLGQTVPMDSLVEVVEAFNSKYVLTSISVQPKQMTTEEFFTQLSTKLPNCTIFATGYELKNYHGNIPENIKIFCEPEELAPIYT